MVAEDVDMESLQAQIDMAMSFGHNLVTSWIKPSQFRSSGVDATQMLEEEIRRPPRLGVGASIPVMPLLVHEASKLKRRLGKNREKNVGELQLQDSSRSDEDEHKGRPAKRKTKVDPFANEGTKKKRKAELETNPRLPVGPSPRLNNLIIGQKSFASNERQRMIGPSDQRSAVSSPAEPSRETSAPVPGRTKTPESIRVHDDSMPMPDNAKALGIPLLNLDGPPVAIDKSGNDIEVNNLKRKRRRRKKKKSRGVAGTVGN